jgi:hypothetical protein
MILARQSLTGQEALSEIIYDGTLGEGRFMQPIQLKSLALAVLAFTLCSFFSGQPARAYEDPSIIGACRECLESAVTDSGKRASIAAFFTGLACVASGPASPLVCPIAAGGAAAASALVDLTAASRCAQQSACVRLAAALKEKTKTNCELPDAGKKGMVRTLTFCRNGFGTTFAQSCNASHAGSPSAGACTNLHCPTSNSGC